MGLSPDDKELLDYLYEENIKKYGKENVRWDMEKTIHVKVNGKEHAITVGKTDE